MAEREDPDPVVIACDVNSTVARGLVAAKLPVALEPDVTVDRVGAAVAREQRSGQIPQLWDGRAAGRITDVLEKAFTR